MAMSLPGPGGHGLHHTPRPLPGVREAILYVNNNGLRRSLGKFLAGHVIGRERWYMTREDLARSLKEPPSIPRSTS